jgi:tape measure domain-containing protein
MLEIPIKVGVSKEQADKAITDFANNVRDSLDDIIGPGGYNLSVNVNFKSSGIREVSSKLTEAKTGAEGYEANIKKMARTQEGSLTSLRQSVNTLKQQRDALQRGSEAWKGYNNQISQTTAKLRAQQGIQVGSLTDLRRQRDELIKLRDATARFPSGPGGGGDGPTWNDLNSQIKAIDGSINKITPGFNRFFGVLSKVATVQAGFIAITSAIGAIGGVINAYIGRTKQIEAFSLALKNVGLTQAETSSAFEEARSIAARLGAPLQQVEKSYQRMVPALRAAGISAKDTDKFIEAISARTQTLGLNTEQSGRLIEAFAQALSKGKLQSEELNQQISELDGAFRTQLADSIGVSVEKLTELVEAGEITSDVLVPAVIGMSNGVDALRKRIEQGNATIQQFQNLIQGINVDILSNIGKQIEPGVRAFLSLSLAVSEFFLAFSKTDTFAALATIFNQIAKGLEVFVKNLLEATKVVESLLSPIFSLIDTVLGLDAGFGGLIGLLINLTGGLLLLKGSLAGLSVINKVTKNLQKFSDELFVAGRGVDYLSKTTNKSNLNTFRQGLENVRAISTGLVGKIKQTITGFLNLESTIKKSGDIAKSGSSQFKQLDLALGATAASARKTKPSLDSIALSIGTKFANSINNTADKIGLFINKLRGIPPQTQQLGLALDQVGYKADNLGNKFKNLAIKAASSLKQIAASLSDLAISAAIGGVIAAVERGINVNKAAAEATKQYAEANNVGAAKARLFLEEQRKAAAITAKAGSQTTQSFKESSAAVNEYSNQQNNAANANKAIAVGFTTAAIGATAFAIKLGIAAAGLAATIGTAGAAGPFIAALGAKAFLVAAAGAGAATVAVKKWGDASKDLEKSAGGRNFLNSIKEQSKATGDLVKNLENFGGKINQTDFSSFPKGSASLQALNKTYQQIIETSDEYIEAKRREVKAAEEQLASAKDDSEVKKLKATISLGKDQIKNYEALRDSAKASVDAIKEQTAARIASGSADDLAKASAEELTAALKLQTNAVDASALDERTKALQKYGKTQAEVGQLESSNLGIELGAVNQRLAAYQRILDALNKRKAEGKVLSADEKELASQLTKTIAEETLKQTEIQKQLGDAIVAGFERGIQKAREIAGVYGQVASQAKSQFEGIFSGVTSGVSAALSLVDAVAGKELEGVQQGSLLRKKIILEQLRAAAQANAFEAQLAQFKLAVQNKLAQNEARRDQLRFQTEAKLAELRGETGLAQAYREAAAVQGDIINGLQVQYQIESKALDLQRQAKDQQLIQKGLSEGIGRNSREAASWIGVQNINLKDARKSLSDMINSGGKLVRAYGDAAANASDVQTSAEGTQMGRAEEEANKVKDAFEESRNSVVGMNESLAETPDLVMAVAGRFTDLNSSIEKTKSAIEAIDRILGGTGSQGSRRGAARAMGGPVSAGSQYFVNDGGGREGFVNKFGNFSMLPAGRNINWTAPSSGMVIPAQMVDRYRHAADLRKQIDVSMASTMPSTSRANNVASGLDSGNLIQRVASAMSGTGGTQRITNNVTIQSQEPVMDASKIMTNVARMRLRNARRG